MKLNTLRTQAHELAATATCLGLGKKTTTRVGIAAKRGASDGVVLDLHGWFEKTRTSTNRLGYGAKGCWGRGRTPGGGFQWLTTAERRFRLDLETEKKTPKLQIT